MSSFRILALDGGGIKGAFTAGVLAALEKDTGKRCVEHFDLIAGTSTGGIIAIGLGLGLPAEEIADFYEQDGPAIFPSTGFTRRLTAVIRHLFQPKHSHDVLRNALTKILGDRKLGESQTRLLIPAYDAIAGRIFLLKTAHHERFKYEYMAPAVDVALATAAAPTYFAAAPFPTHENASYVDGGVWANSPTLAALVEAVHFLNVPLDQIDILSIGTTTSPFSIAKKHRSGILGWNTGLLDVLMNAQQEAANAQAMLLTGHQFHRINHLAPQGTYTLDDARPEQVERLINLGRSEAVKKEHIDVVTDRFLNGTPAEPFEPVYAVDGNASEEYRTMTWQQWLDNWGMTGLKINVGVLEAEWKPQDPDRDAAWELYIELLTRIATQPLESGQGTDRAALESIYSLFPLTRETIKRHGRHCDEFTKIAVLVLNQIVRPFTTKWHGHAQSGDLDKPTPHTGFRTELTALQQDLHKYTKMLADMADVEDLTGLADDTHSE